MCPTYKFQVFNAVFHVDMVHSDHFMKIKIHQPVELFEFTSFCFLSAPLAVRHLTTCPGQIPVATPMQLELLA